MIVGWWLWSMYLSTRTSNFLANGPVRYSTVDRSSLDFDLLRLDTVKLADLRIYQWRANYNLSIWLKNQDIIELWWIGRLSGSIKTIQNVCCFNKDGQTLQNIFDRQLMMELLALTFNKSSFFFRYYCCFCLFLSVCCILFFLFHWNESFYEITKLIWNKKEKKKITRKNSSFVKS